MLMPSPTTVFEFNATTIRVCRCVTRKRKRVLTHCFAFCAGRDEKETQALVNTAVKKNTLNPENVILSLPRYAAIARLKSIPAQDPEEISQIVAIYAARESKHAYTGVCAYDYQHVGFDRQGQALVQIFFVKKECVSSYVRILSGVGILPERVTLNTQGLLNWSSSLGSDDKTEVFRCVPVLNIDDHVFDFNMFFNGKTIYSRSIPHSEAGLPALAKEVKVSLESCRRISDYYSSGGIRLYVTGKTDRFDIGDFEALLSYPVEKFDPIEGLNVRQSIKAALRDDIVSYASVIGLAMGGQAEGGIDITPEELAAQKMYFCRSRSYQRLIVFSAVFLLLVSLFVLRLLQLKEEMIFKKRGEIRRFLVFEKSPFAIKREDAVRRVLSGHNEICGIFGELYRLTPDFVFLTELVIDDGNLESMSGSSNDPALIGSYLKVLKESPFFSSASLEYIHQNHAGAVKRSDFKIHFG